MPSARSTRAVRCGAACLLLVLGSTPPLYAAGYFAGNRGVQATARGGAFVAKADDVTALIYNPAGLAFIDGTELSVVNRFSYAVNEYTRAPTLDYGASAVSPPLTEFAPEKSGGFRALDPFIALGTNLGLRNWGFALAVYAPPGSAATQYGPDAGSRYMVVASETVMLNVALSAAYRVSQDFSIGLTFHAITMPRLRYSVVVNANPFPRVASPVSDPLDMQISIDAKDYFTPDLTLGVWGRPAPFLELGASLQALPVAIKARGRLRVDSVGLEQNVMLSRPSSDGTAQPADDVEVGIPLPLIARAGARYVVRNAGREVFDLEFDAIYETWSRVERLRLETRGLQARFLGQEFPIAAVNLDKHWDDTFAMAVGAGLSVLPERLRVMGGVYFESQLADPAYSTADTEAGAHVGAGLGASLRLDQVELGLALEYRRQLSLEVSEVAGKVYQQLPNAACKAPYNDTSTCAASTLGSPGPVVNAGAYHASLWGLSVGAAYHF